MIAIAYTIEEGGEWIPFADKMKIDEVFLSHTNLLMEVDGQWKAIHSMKFEDGREWDVVNGWRP